MKNLVSVRNQLIVASAGFLIMVVAIHFEWDNWIKAGAVVFGIGVAVAFVRMIFFRK